jgi:NADH dehydrogenase FAD-containing subunit
MSALISTPMTSGGKHQEKRHQVVIVGGGPVGVALAVELGLRGVTCASWRAASLQILANLT